MIFYLKVSKTRKQIMMSLILPKTNETHSGQLQSQIPRLHQNIEINSDFKLLLSNWSFIQN